MGSRTAPRSLPWARWLLVVPITELGNTRTRYGEKRSCLWSWACRTGGAFEISKCNLELTDRILGSLMFSCFKNSSSKTTFRGVASWSRQKNVGFHIRKVRVGTPVPTSTYLTWCGFHFLLYHPGTQWRWKVIALEKGPGEYQSSAKWSQNHIPALCTPHSTWYCPGQGIHQYLVF